MKSCKVTCTAPSGIRTFRGVRFTCTTLASWPLLHTESCFSDSAPPIVPIYFIDEKHNVFKMHIQS